MKWFFTFVLLLALSTTVSARRSVWNPADCEEGTLNALDASGASGDTINWPAQTCIWTSTVTFTKAFKMVGAGVGQTIIQDNIDDGSRLFDWFCDTSGTHEMSGIEFEDGGRGSIFQSTTVGVILFWCSSASTARWNIHDNKFDHLNASPMVAPSNMLGVIHHNEFLFDSSKTPIYCYAQYWKATGNYGDNSWADALAWGSEENTFIEANTFTHDAGGQYALFDAVLGCRAVLRFNTGTRVEISAHGTESGGRNRGTRAIEVYNNAFNKGGEACSAVVDLRSGSALVFRNSLDNCGSWVGSPKSMSLVDDRTTAAFTPWSSASGDNDWDINHASSPFYTGVVDSAVSFLLTVSPSPMWADSQWLGYILKKTSTCSGNCSSLITGTNATQLSWSGTDGHGTEMSFSAGDTFEINRVLETLDQPGRGGGTFISGDPPTASPVPYDQVDEPIYEWLNTNDASSIHAIAHPSCGYGSIPICRENEHYYNYTTSFDGTVGVGSGTRASRPATCTTGVTYWATDQGAWNSSGAGGQGVLDKCTSTDTWTNAWYTPYIYPHPLVANGISSVIPVGTRTRVRMK